MVTVIGLADAEVGETLPVNDLIEDAAAVGQDIEE